MTFKTFKTISVFLQKLGLSDEESEVYLSLVGKGLQSADSLAKNTKIPKTNIYRRFDSLLKMGLLEKHLEDKKTLVKTTSPLLLSHLVEKKEDESKTMRELLPFITQSLSTQSGLEEKNTRILSFKGREGIEQMLWNMLEAQDEIVGYTYRTLSDIIGEKTTAKWNEEFEDKKLKIRDLYSDEYLKSTKTLPKINFGNPKNSQSRYLPSKILNITHQMDIYNDVLSIYNWYDGEVFGIEIHNHKIASMQKQIFEILWPLAKATDTTD